MASYRVTAWFHPGAYYSALFPDVTVRGGRANRQHYLAGTAGLHNPLKINPPDISTAQRYWGAFFAKTTAHF